MIITVNQPYNREILGIANKLAINVLCKILNNHDRFSCKNCRGGKGNHILNAK